MNNPKLFPLTKYKGLKQNFDLSVHDMTLFCWTADKVAELLVNQRTATLSLCRR